MKGTTRSPGVSQKLAPGYQKTSDSKLTCQKLASNHAVTKPSGPGKGSTRGGPSQKVTTRIKT